MIAASRARAPVTKLSRSTYRRLALGWRPGVSRERAFHGFAIGLTLLLLGAGFVLDQIELPERQRERAEVPERVARYIDMRELPPPPPPPPEVQPPPPPAVAAPSPAPTPAPAPPTERVTRERQAPAAPASEREAVARERAAQSGLLAHAAALGDLLETDAVAAKVQRQNAPREAAARARADAGALTASARVDSGGVSGAGLAVEAGETELAAAANASVEATLANAGLDSDEAATSGGASRTQEEITLVVDRYKSQLQALYNRARRTNPALKGKLVLAITIQPNGTVSAVKVVESELKDSKLVANIVARVKTFAFTAKDVAVVTVNYPIEFLP